jgi:hypothetical protein
LKLVLGPELFTLAIEMLTETAVSACLTAVSLAALEKGYEFADQGVRTAAEEILRVLEHDGYLKAGKQGYVFESHLLKDWWAKRYGQFYVPVLERGV